MSICRTHKKTRNFSILQNDGFEDSRLSYKARGIFGYLMIKPDGWEVRMSDLENNSEKDGRDGVRAAFKELLDLGYAYREKVRIDGGRFRWETHVFETPDEMNEWLRSHGRLSVDGQPPMDDRQRQGVGIVNTDSSNTQQVNTKEEEITGTGQAQGSAPAGSVNPVEVETTSLSSQKDEADTEADQPGSEAYSSAAPPPKKAAPKAAAIYARIKDLARFERFWAWYSKEFCSVTTHNGGSKSEAGAAWLHLEQTDYLGVGVEGFNQGVKIQIRKRPQDGVGIQHACRFLCGGSKGEPDWLVDYQESIATDSVSPKAFLADLAGIEPGHPPDDLEARKARKQAEILAQARAEADRLLGAA